MNVLESLVGQLDQLSKSEKKVAQIILADPKAVIHQSIAVLAKTAQVSEPTVNRFCHRMGTKGYPDFKLHLAQDLATGTPFVNRHVQQTDTSAEYTAKIFESTMAALNTANKHVSTDAIAQAVSELARAQKISFMGLGASASVAHDAQNKFLRFDIPVSFSDDILMQRMAALNSKAGDVIVCISHTGRTKQMCEIADLARNNGAFVMGITAASSPLAAACDLVLSSHVPEDTDVYMPMASRIAHLVIVDVLVTGFTLERGPACQQQLKIIKDHLKASRYEVEPSSK